MELLRAGGTIFHFLCMQLHWEMANKEILVQQADFSRGIIKVSSCVSVEIMVCNTLLSCWPRPLQTGQSQCEMIMAAQWRGRCWTTNRGWTRMACQSGDPVEWEPRLLSRCVYTRLEVEVAHRDCHHTAYQHLSKNRTMQRAMQDCKVCETQKVFCCCNTVILLKKCLILEHKACVWQYINKTNFGVMRHFVHRTTSVGLCSTTVMSWSDTFECETIQISEC